MLRQAVTGDERMIHDFVLKVTDESDYLLYTKEERINAGFTYDLINYELTKKPLYLIVNLDKKIVANLIVTANNIQSINHSVEFSIAVLKEYQNMHLATQLMRELIKWFNKSNYTRLECEVVEQNSIALELYKKFNFKVEGIKQNAYFKNNKYYNIVVLAILK